MISKLKDRTQWKTEQDPTFFLRWTRTRQGKIEDDLRQVVD
jgi:hypothetical protein